MKERNENTDTNINTDTSKTEFQFIYNKVLKIVYMKNGNKLAKAMVAYL